MKYIGQKVFYSYQTKKALKKDKQRKGHIQFLFKNKNHKRVKYELIKIESNWKDYEGSIKQDIEDTIVKKEILQLCPTKRSMLYLETKWLMIKEVLEKENYYNGNILGKFYKNTIFV